MRFNFAPIIAGMFLLCSCVTHYQQIKVDRVELYLKKDAEDIKIAYSLDQFAPHDTRKISNSKWMASIPTTGEFQYFYIVDGAVFLPQCPYKERDDFGSENCIFQPDE
jgi:hypothetical protein